MPPAGSRGTGARLAAWGVHLLTASGAVVALLALDAVAEGDARAALLWMSAAVLIDALDGPLARWLDVKRRVPGVDGALLDNLVDYANFVLVPAFFLHRAGLVAGGLVGPALVCLASAYQFAQRDAKTSDHFFLGFPSYWNVLALYLYVLGATPGVGLALVVGCALLVFVPLRWVYPSRTPRWRMTTVGLGLLWGASLLVCVLALPDPPRAVAWASLLYVAYYVAASLWLGGAKGGG